MVILLHQEYIHRVGRTACGEGANGNALLFLIPEDAIFRLSKGLSSFLFVNQSTSFHLLAKAFIMISPEFKFSIYLQEARVPVKEYAIDDKKLAKVQPHLVCFLAGEKKLCFHIYSYQSYLQYTSFMFYILC